MTRWSIKGFFVGVGTNVVLLGMVSLFTDLSSQMVFPLLPLYLTSVLGASAYLVGAVEGAAETTASLVRVFSGYWSDKLKRRKPFILLGYGMSSFIKPLFAVANVWGLVLFFRALERVGKGLRTAPRDALVAESCHRSVRGRAYGFQRAMDGIGSVLGALSAYLALPILGYRGTFLLAFLPGLLAVAAIFFVTEKATSAAPHPEQPKAQTDYRQLPPNLRRYLFAAALFSLGHFGYPFLLLRAQDVGLSDHRAVLLYAVFYLIYSLCSIPSGILSDKVGRKPILAAGYFLFALISLGLLFVRESAGVLIAFILYGVFFAMIDGVQRAFVVDLAPQNLRGTALGAFHAVISLTALPGAVLAGLLWETIGPEATFAYGAILSLVALAVFSYSTASYPFHIRNS